MALHSLRQILGGAHIITSVFETLQDIDEIGHSHFLGLERPPVNKKAHLIRDGLFEFGGGDDGTRTRDLRRDRPAF